MAASKGQDSNPSANTSAKTEADAISTHLLLSALTSLETAVRSANDLPLANTLEFACTAYPKIKTMARATSSQILTALRSVGSRYDITFGAIDGDSDNADSELSAAAYDEVYEHVGQVSEEILERFNVDLDAARGIKNAVVPAGGAIEPGFKIQGARELERPKGGLGWVEMDKPQVKFPDYPIDNSDTPFVPPYSETADGAGNVGSYLQDLYKANSDAGGVGLVGGKHPYEKEICSVAEEMGRKPFDEKNTMLFTDLDSSPCTFVDTDDVLFEMAEQLKKAREIAVDIENHSMRSFQGFTCLIQFSTRRADFVVDALALRGSIHRALAPVFSDEGMVKVMHGADKDVEWLERDFGIYVVNLFDTGQAARALNFPSFSLSHLLARFCSVPSPNKKKFQLADWRRRPLPKAMFEYARSDTHYLLYTYDRLRAELGKTEKLAAVWTKSAVVARRRHAKVRYDERMPRRLAAKYGLGFDRHQIRLFEELHRWRDRKAREEDESLHYVAPVKSLLGIVRARDHCKTVKGLLEKGFPSNNLIPPLIRANVKELVTLITHTLDSAQIDDEEERNKGGEKEENAGRDKATHGSLPPSGKGETLLVSDVKEQNASENVVEGNEIKSGVERQVVNGDTGHLNSMGESHDNEGGQVMNKKGRGWRQGQAVTGSGKGPKAGVVKLKLASRSVFDFSSDEEEGTGEQKEVVPGKGDHGESRQNDREAWVGDVEKDGNLKGTGTHLRERGVFDMSIDESEGELGKTREIIAQVRAGMTQLGPSCPAEFRVEGDKVEKKGSEDKEAVSEKKRGREEEVEEVEKPVVQSLSEMYGIRGNGKRKKKARKKAKNGSELADVGAEEPDKLEPFDYRKMRESGEAKSEEKSFDPLEKLRNDWKDKKSNRGRVRKPRKRPGSGARSMSFKAR